uniref:Uncharacterized protein n=1 Tax=Anguilla anguilla TaxID=7936 RepID=A0A0E9WZL4_ANGAN
MRMSDGFPVASPLEAAYTAMNKTQATYTHSQKMAEMEVDSKPMSNIRFFDIYNAREREREKHHLHRLILCTLSL